jgi:peptidoglycan/LPS O-acetylase OafA/YrhL
VILSILHIARVKGFIITTTSLEQAIFSALTFHVNWLEAKTGYLPGAWDVLWSLSIEEIFYLFFPLLCLLVRSEMGFKFIMIIFIVLGPFARYIFSDNDIWSDHSYLSCMDGIAIGCLAALYVNKFKIGNKSLLFLFLTGLLFFLFDICFQKASTSAGFKESRAKCNLTRNGYFIYFDCHS